MARRIRMGRFLGGRDTTVFLLSLLLASSIWLIHNLSLNYSAQIQVPVAARCNVEGHAALSVNSTTVLARCRTSGFNLIRFRRSSGQKPLEVSFDPADMHPRGGDWFYVAGADLNRYVPQIFGDETKIEVLLTDTLAFRFPVENHKRVPVVPMCSVSYRPQYTGVGEIRMNPDSVTVYGEPFHLENIDRILTQAFTLEDISSSVHGSVPLEVRKGLRTSHTVVEYSLDVERYVEIRVSVPVVGRNVPADRTLLVYPPTAEVRLRCAFPMTAELEENLDFYVDYKVFAQSLTGRCLPDHDPLPPGVIDFAIRPEVFDCVERVR